MDTSDTYGWRYRSRYGALTGKLAMPSNVAEAKEWIARAEAEGRADLKDEYESWMYSGYGEQPRSRRTWHSYQESPRRPTPSSVRHAEEWIARAEAEGRADLKAEYESWLENHRRARYHALKRWRTRWDYIVKEHRTCKHCGGPIPDSARIGARTCSTKCRSALYRARKRERHGY